MTRFPLALTMFRLITGVAFLPLVHWHAPAWLFVALVLVGLSSDIADGIIARRLGVDTLALRRLDTRADMVFYGCAIIAALIQASFPLARLWPWLAAYLLLFAVRNLIDFLRYHASPSYHMWSGKLWSLVLFAHLVALFCGTRALVFLPLAFVLYAINALEGIVATLILAQPRKDIPTVWHAFVLVRGV